MHMVIWLFQHHFFTRPSSPLSCLLCFVKDQSGLFLGPLCSVPSVYMLILLSVLCCLNYCICIVNLEIGYYCSPALFFSVWFWSGFFVLTCKLYFLFIYFWSLFSQINYVENPRVSRRRLLDLPSEDSKVSGYKVNIWDRLLSYATWTMELWDWKCSVTYHGTNKMKYLGTNVTNVYRMFM